MLELDIFEKDNLGREFEGTKILISVVCINPNPNKKKAVNIINEYLEKNKKMTNKQCISNENNNNYLNIKKYDRNVNFIIVTCKHLKLKHETNKHKNYWRNSGK